MSNRNRIYIVGAVVIITILGIIGFQVLSPKAKLEEIPINESKINNNEQIVLAVHPYDSPVVIARNFAPLINYLNENLDKQFVLSVSKTYESHIERIGKDQVDIAYIGPAAYVSMTELFGNKKLLCAFENNEFSNFQGYILTRNDNPATSLKDLEGKSFGCSSRQSTMGYIAPRYLFISENIKFPNEHLKILKSHNNVCLNILSGEVNAGAVRKQTYMKYKDRELKVIAVTPTLIDHPFLATNRVDNETILKIKETLLKIETEEDVVRILKPIKTSAIGLRNIKDSEYDQLRDILIAVQQDEKRTTENSKN